MAQTVPVSPRVGNLIAAFERWQTALEACTGDDLAKPRHRLIEAEFADIDKARQLAAQRDPARLLEHLNRPEMADRFIGEIREMCLIGMEWHSRMALNRYFNQRGLRLGMLIYIAEEWRKETPVSPPVLDLTPTEVKAAT